MASQNDKGYTAEWWRKWANWLVTGSARMQKRKYLYRKLLGGKEKRDWSPSSSVQDEAGTAKEIQLQNGFSPGRYNVTRIKRHTCSLVQWIPKII